MATFDIIKDRWLDAVRIDGTVATLSVKELLANAHALARLSESSPLTEVALLRFLIALVSDGLREKVPTEEAWGPFVERCRYGFSADVVDAIIAPLKGRSDVLDPEHDGFFDGPTVRSVPGWDAPEALQTASRVLPEIPTGTNLAHFVHTSDPASALCVGCLLKSRAVDAAFARGGLGPSISRNLLATIGGTEPRYVIPSARTLLGTFLLNAVVGDDSRPSWYSIHRHNDGEPGPIARLTWRPRLMMPAASSKTDLPCVRCATTYRSRFAHVVLVDTYNHKGSPFGTKGDVEKWKVVAGDPHLVPSVKGSLNIGINHNEWPLRAISRLLAGEATRLLNKLPQRSVLIDDSVTIRATSSAGNQAKVDDAPCAAVHVPSALFARTQNERVSIAADLATLFEKAHRDRRKQLIPCAVPMLLSDLAVAEEPGAVVENWLTSTVSLASDRTVRGAREVASIDDYELRDVAKRMVNRLGRLTSKELAALRRRGKSGMTAGASWQQAFEVIWHRLSAPSRAKRHAMREALATVAPIYAAYPNRHSKKPFLELLREKLDAERSISHRPNALTPVKRLLSIVISASPGSRDLLLMRLVDELLEGGPNRQMGSINFTDLLMEVSHWNDPIDPTPARWRRLLQST